MLKWSYVGLKVTNLSSGFSSKARLKPVSQATEVGKKIEISHVANLDMKLSNKRTNKDTDQSPQTGW